MVDSKDGSDGFSRDNGGDFCKPLEAPFGPASPREETLPRRVYHLVDDVPGEEL